MPRFLKPMDATRGRPPGSLVFVGEQRVESPSIRIIHYDAESIDERELGTLEGVECCREAPAVTWVNVDGLHDVELMGKVRDAFGLHPLVMEDVLDTGQRPKLAEFDGCLALTAKMLRLVPEDDTVHAEQLSLVLGRNWLLTFQELPGDVFDPVRERLRRNRGRIRKLGADYLAYALLDVVMENYLRVLTHLGEHIESLEEVVLLTPTPGILESITGFKMELGYIRKAARPTRDFIQALSHLDTEFVSDDLAPFLRDLYDLSEHVNEAIDAYSAMLSDYIAIYNSNVGNRLNDIMKFLTMFSSIFIPLAFIAGVYGMNFDNIPELHYRYGYFVFWGLIVLVVLGMLRFFRSKGWL
ncbi:magnesium transporter [Desulfobaculum xiamenense]|uniref:Magnesium transport protein CorA n=1 Tax=Desulfobaculum xiamenense TaxID=995050 RepID=A0A846QN12_9BACT|nr:magnesium/cobalt transporter CorA [Desulfobaculum xiamenense]NJB66805.1 magnesium transporter [Desulfobaculum xiamenense]